MFSSGSWISGVHLLKSEQRGCCDNSGDDPVSEHRSKPGSIVIRSDGAGRADGESHKSD